MPNLYYFMHAREEPRALNKEKAAIGDLDKAWLPYFAKMRQLFAGTVIFWLATL